MTSEKLQIIIREIIQTILTNYYQRYYPINSYKLLSQKSFQKMLSNYYQRNHSKQFLQIFITEVISNNAYKLFQTILSIYCHRNHSKQFLQTFIEEVIQNNAFRLLPEKSFQTILTNFYHIILIRFLDNDILITINLIWVILLRLSIKQVI